MSAAFKSYTLNTDPLHLLQQALNPPPAAAGTGKSLVLKHIIRALPAGSTFITAPTGLAASALGGTTLHAFAGVGRAEGEVQALIKAASRPDALRRWRAASVLIIDEVRGCCECHLHHVLCLACPPLLTASPDTRHRHGDVELACITRGCW